MNELKVLIVAGGELSSQILYDVTNNTGYGYIIGVDGGNNTLDKIHFEPDMIVGDFDSSDQNIVKKYANSPKTKLLNPKKDLTDTHFAVLEAIKLKPKSITILGATGKRLDHFMGNLAMLKLCLDNGISAEILDKHNRITMIDKQMTISKRRQYGRYVSLIPYSDVVEGISLEGFCYELSDATMVKADTLGISNEIKEEEGRITIKKGYLMVMETMD